MHVPNPLGGYPLVLRNSNAANPRKGELLYDYEKNDLYYVNKQTGQKGLLAKEIYDKIIAARLQNTFVEITKSDGQGSEKETPDVENRVMNHFYMNITKRA